MVNIPEPSRPAYVFAGVDRNARQPGLFGCISSESVQIPIGFEKRFLYRVLRLLLVAQVHDAKAEQWKLVQVHHAFDSRFLAVRALDSLHGGLTPFH